MVDTGVRVALRFGSDDMGSPRLIVETAPRPNNTGGPSYFRQAYRHGKPKSLSIRHSAIFGEGKRSDDRALVPMVPIRGKSGLQWTGRQVTPGRGQRELLVTESATEKRPPSFGVARVKRWGKSPPHSWQHERHGKPRLEQGQICGERCPPRSRHRG